MKDIQWDNLASLFEQAIELPAHERMAFLDKVCSENVAMRQELDSLLKNHVEATPFFESLRDVVPFPDKKIAVNREDPHQLIGKRITKYEVIDWLGGGGMGVLYRAEDVELQRKVALKFLSPTLSHDTNARDRFIVEARAASSFDHPNICTIHEIGRTEAGQIFIAMTFYDGETLKEKCSRGVLEIDEALDYARQVARGLKKAHTHGIIHRDIKPANIMVTHDGVVKILDFGLAKMVEQQLTQSGATMGTVAYMSPEQVRGDVVDSRTDIWSLGVLMYEMISGERPFNGALPHAVIYNILNVDPTFGDAFQTEGGPELSRIVAKCLEKDPDNRYQTTEQLLEALGSADSGSIAGSPQWSGTSSRASWKYSSVFIGVLLLVGLFLIPAVRETAFSIFAPASMPGDPQRIAVLPFTAIPSGDAENDALAEGLMYVLTGLLSNLESSDRPLMIVPATEIRSYEVYTSREATDLFGVDAVLQGNMRKMSQGVQLYLELIDTRQAIVVQTETSLLNTATITNTLSPDFEEQMLVTLSQLLDIPIDDDVRQLARAHQPKNTDAYAFYVQGVGYLQRFDLEGNFDHAIRLFEQALEEDSLYALAHAGLCEATWEKYELLNRTDLVTQALQSCDRAVSLADDQASVLIPLASIYLRTSNYDDAERTLRRALELEPDNAEAFRWLGRVYEDRGLFEEAKEAYQKALELKPENWIYNNDYGIMLSYASLHEEAKVQFERIQRLTPDNYLAYNSLAFTHLQLNNVDLARDLFLESIEKNDANFIAYRNLGYLYFRERDYARAIEYLDKAKEFNENDWWIWRWYGHVYHWMGDEQRARAAWQQLLNLALPNIEFKGTDVDLLCGLAEAYAALGDRERSNDYLRRLESQTWTWNYITHYVGRTYEMLGQRDKAIEYVNEALANNYDRVTITQDPWLDELRLDERFNEPRSND